MRARTVSIAIAALLGIAGVALAVFVATFDANRYKPQLVELVREHTGRTLTIEGDLSLSLWPRIGLAAGAAALSGPDGRGEAARIERGTAAVAIRPLFAGRLHVEALALRGLRLSLGEAEAGGGWRLEDARLDAAPIADREPGRLSLEGRLRGGDSGSDLALELASAFVADRATTTVSLTDLKARLRGAMAGLAGVAISAGGQVKLDLAARTVVADTLSIDAMAAGGPTLSLAGSGRAAFSTESAEIALKGKLDEAPIELAAELSRFAPLSAQWSVAAGELDLDRLRAKLAAVERATPPGKPPAERGMPAAGTATEPAAGPGPTAPPPAGTPEQDALPAIADADTRGSLKVERLRVAGLAIGSLAANLATGDGRIAVESLTGRLNGGALKASASMTAAGHRLAGTLAGVDAGSLIRDASGRDPLDGRGDIRLDLSTRGLDGDTALRQLGGTASLALRDGAIKGVDLDRVMQQVRGALEGRLPVEGKPGPGDRTPFQALGANFRIAQGVATSDDLDFRADWLRATGGGRIDLPAQSLDWLVRATMTGTPGGAADPAARRDLLARLQGAPVPVRLSGRFDDLRYRVDMKDLATTAVRKEVERRLAEKLGEKLGLPPAAPGSAEPAENPLDRLKGLLRR
jgi:AsmA protein